MAVALITSSSTREKQTDIHLKFGHRRACRRLELRYGCLGRNSLTSLANFSSTSTFQVFWFDGNREDNLLARSRSIHHQCCYHLNTFLDGPKVIQGIIPQPSRVALHTSEYHQLGNSLRECFTVRCSGFGDLAAVSFAGSVLGLLYFSIHLRGRHLPDFVRFPNIPGR